MSAYDEALKHLTNASLENTETSRQFLRELVEIRSHLRAFERELSDQDRRRATENESLRRDLVELAKSVDRVLSHIGETRREIGEVKEHTGEHRLPRDKGIADLTVGQAAIGVWPYVKRAIPWLWGVVIAGLSAAIYRLIDLLKGHHQ